MCKSYFAEHYCCLQFIFIYNDIQDNNQKQKNFLKITNSGAATQQWVVRFMFFFFFKKFDIACS